MKMIGRQPICRKRVLLLVEYHKKTPHPGQFIYLSLILAEHETRKDDAGRLQTNLYNYIYNAKIRKNGKIRWACTKAYGLGCKGVITTDDPMGNPRGLVVHNHGPCAETVETTKFRQDRKEMARLNTGSKTHDIL